jgi:YD repeat-containing protein
LEIWDGVSPVFCPIRRGCAGQGYHANGEQTGRTLSGTAYTLAYDYDGQLTSISTGGSVQSSFAYGASGRRVSRPNGGTTTKFYYGNGQILVEMQGSTTTAVYTYIMAIYALNLERKEHAGDDLR